MKRVRIQFRHLHDALSTLAMAELGRRETLELVRRAVPRRHEVAHRLVRKLVHPIRSERREILHPSSDNYFGIVVTVQPFGAGEPDPRSDGIFGRDPRQIGRLAHVEPLGDDLLQGHRGRLDLHQHVGRCLDVVFELHMDLQSHRRPSGGDSCRGRCAGIGQFGRERETIPSVSASDETKRKAP